MMELFFFLSLFPVAVEEFAVVSNVSPSSFFREFKKDKFVWRVPHTLMFLIIQVDKPFLSSCL